jgi:hypothetical protein
MSQKYHHNTLLPSCFYLLQILAAWSFLINAAVLRQTPVCVKMGVKCLLVTHNLIVSSRKNQYVSHYYEQLFL